MHNHCRAASTRQEAEKLAHELSCSYLEGVLPDAINLVNDLHVTG